MNTKAILKKLSEIKASTKELRTANADHKNRVLLKLAKMLTTYEKEILSANAHDIKNLKKGTAPAFMDRLILTSHRINQMVTSLLQIAELPDPVGEEVENKVLSNGLKIRRVRSPLGVIFMIFESRPNVAVEAFSLAFKSGNSIILRGGSESTRSTEVLYKMIDKAIESGEFSGKPFWGITDVNRKIPQFLLKQSQSIDIVVPRGGDSLIKYVVTNSEIPIIKNDRGLCHVYVHSDAELNMAREIVLNAKVQRPGVCNAMETVLIHEAVAKEFLPPLYDSLSTQKVEWFVCPVTFRILKGRKKMKKATIKNWNTEYLDLKINCRVVGSYEEAVSHIELYGSKHSEAIVTSSQETARRFQSEVDAAAVYWNASTRFTDGFEFGLGGELGISTQKLHVRGPVGLRELTSLRWIVDGSGQVRG